MRILITGFPAFPGRPLNPSQQIVEAVRGGGLEFHGVELRAELLPVEYAGVEEAYCRLLEEFQPEVVLAFGVGRGPALLSLESRGINLDDAPVADNAGELRSSLKIRPDGPEEFHPQVDLVTLVKRLQAAGVDAEVSGDAGTYVCNHLLYFALSRSLTAAVAPRFLFAHVAPPEGGFDLEQALTALKVMVGWFQTPES